MPEEGAIKILFVINPVSGGNTKTDWAAEIRRYFEALPFEISLYELDENCDLNALRKRLKEFRPHRAVAVGGDGTVSLLAKELAGTEIALGILPAGSANGMAKELNLPTAIEQAMSLIAEGTAKNADLIRVNGDRICLHLSDIGLNAKLIKHFEEGKFRGKLGYASKVIKTLWTRSSIRVTVSTDNKQVTHSAFMVVLANARMYGTGAVINPDGDLYDGKFEVVIVRKIALTEILKMLFKPQPFNPKKIRVLHTTSVSISTNRPAHFQIDGEYLGKVKKVDADIMAGQLKLIIPQ